MGILPDVNPHPGIRKVELPLSLSSHLLRREEDVRQHRYNGHDHHHHSVGSLLLLGSAVCLWDQFQCPLGIRNNVDDEMRQDIRHAILACNHRFHHGCHNHFDSNPASQYLYISSCAFLAEGHLSMLKKYAGLLKL